MTDDTHDKLVQVYLEYFAENERFDVSPSHRNSRTTRRLLRQLISLAKQRQDEIRQRHLERLKEWREKNPEKAKKK
jgi:hypothetical protein